MGLDVTIEFRDEINYADIEQEFAPFSRGLTNFIIQHVERDTLGPDSLLLRVQNIIGVDVEFLTEPNLYDYKVNDLQLEFAENEERERLLKQQKELDKEAHKAWCPISNYLNELERVIAAILASDKMPMLDYDKKRWLNYFDNGDFIKDLKGLQAVLVRAQSQNQKDFSFLIR